MLLCVLTGPYISLCPLTCDSAQGRRSEAGDREKVVSTYSLMDPRTHAPGPHACSLAGSPHRLAHRVPTHARSQGLHTCTHRAHAHVLAPGLHMRSLIGSPCTRICVCWMHHVCIPQLYVLGGLYVVVVVLFCNLV